jgi:hypothetical protein
MAGTSIKDVLGAEVLLGMTGDYAKELPITHLPPGLFRGRCVHPINSNTGYVLVGAGTNKTAKVAQRGSPGRPVTISGISRRPEVLLHSSNSIELKADLLMNLVNGKGDNNGQAAQEVFAKTEIARQVRESVVLSTNLRTQALSSLFGLGKIWYDVNGDALASSSNATVTVDPGIPANNLNLLNGLITASWATSSTPIVQNLMSVNRQCLVNGKGRTGPIEHAVYGLNIFKYIYDNTEASAYLSRMPGGQQAFAAGTIPQGFAGIKNWWPGYMGFYNNASDTTVFPFGDDTLALFPEPDPSWYELQEGIQAVPDGAVMQGASLEDVLSNASIKSGMFSYCVPRYNPLAAEMIFGDNFLPAIHIPEVVFIADVTP